MVVPELDQPPMPVPERARIVPLTGELRPVQGLPVARVRGRGFPGPAQCGRSGTDCV
jgi:hypothetical protein